MRLGFAVVCLGFLATACTTPQPATTNPTIYRPAVDFSTWRSAIAGPTTKVAVLGSTHLSQLSGTFDPTTLEPLLAKLAAFNPTIITHEGLSGEQCELVQRHAKIYPKIFEDYCRSFSKAIQASEIPFVQARTEVEARLKTWPASPTPSQRRRLAVLFLASGDESSARVQWLQLSASERIKADGINDGLLTLLKRESAKPNETDEIGVVLAARLGLQRIYAVDDHTSDSIQAAAPEGLEAAIQAHWSSADPKPNAPLSSWISKARSLSNPPNFSAANMSLGTKCATFVWLLTSVAPLAIVRARGYSISSAHRIRPITKPISRKCRRWNWSIWRRY
jgi:hypothetical protein